MKYLKKFENENSIRYICILIDDNDYYDNYVFYDIESRDNFVINYVHNYCEGDRDISYNFDVDDLIEYNNDSSYTRIIIGTAESLENVKLEKDIEIKKNSKKYNL